MAVKTARTLDPHLPVYIAEMVAAIDRILAYTEGQTLSTFVADHMRCDAVQHQFEILGEATTHIPFGLKKKWRQIPWAMMYSLRNHIAHEYFDVDYEIIWEIIQHDLKQNKEDLLRFQSAAVHLVGGV